MSGGSALPSTRASDRKRSNGRDAEAERDRRVGRAAPSLAEDAFAAREAHGVGHDEEEAGELEIGDELELVLDLLPLARRRFAPPLAHPFFRPAPQGVVVVDVAHAGADFRFVKVGERGPHPVECEPRAPLGDS
jgi:hypothetical protein